MHPKKNILLTGNPGVGKTTIVKRVISDLKNKGGFFTEEMKEGGKRIGFKIVTINGKKGILAYKEKGEFMVGSYSVNMKDLEEIAVESVFSAIKEKEIVIIDEIGKMEILSPKFKKAVMEALESPKMVIGVIHREDSGFFKKIKERKDVELIEVRFDNRDHIEKKLKEFFKIK